MLSKETGQTQLIVLEFNLKVTLCTFQLINSLIFSANFLEIKG